MQKGAKIHKGAAGCAMLQEDSTRMGNGSSIASSGKRAEAMGVCIEKPAPDEYAHKGVWWQGKGTCWMQRRGEEAHTTQHT